MKFTELSLIELEEKCDEWVRCIAEKYQPDLIIYIAKAGYLIGLRFAEYFHIPLLGITAVRKGDKFKSAVGPVVSKMPRFFRNWIIVAEYAMGYHLFNRKREASILLESPEITKLYHRILLVDDSMDTGITMLESKKLVQETFKDAEIRIASLNVWDRSEKLIKADYSLYRNTIIKSPMSKDSKEYDAFIKALDDYNQKL